MKFKSIMPLGKAKFHILIANRKMRKVKNRFHRSYKYG